MYWISLALVVAPTVFALGWLIFRSWDSFLEAIWYDLMPDIISLFRDQLARDWIAEMKLSLFVICSIIAAAYEKQLVDWLFKH